MKKTKKAIVWLLLIAMTVTIMPLRDAFALSKSFLDGEYLAKAELVTEDGQWVSEYNGAIDENSHISVSGDEIKVSLTLNTAIVTESYINIVSIEYRQNGGDIYRADMIGERAVNTGSVLEEEMGIAPEKADFTLINQSIGDIYVNLVLDSGESVSAILRLDFSNVTESTDKTELTAKVEEAKEVSSSLVTENSYNIIQTAISDGEALLLSEDAQQSELDGAVTAIEASLASLEYLSDASLFESDKDNLENGTYSVSVYLWNSVEDKASMAADAVIETAKIKVQDGVYTMTIYTQEMELSGIKASLIDLKISYSGDYRLAEVSSIENGTPTSFSFTMPSTESYIDVLINPYVEIMGNRDIGARLKIDWTTLSLLEENEEEGNESTEVDKTALANKIAEAKAIDSAAYTAESMSALQTAITTAESAYNNENATQAEVNAQITSLIGAIASLETASTSDNTTTTTTTTTTTKTLDKDNLDDGIYEVAVYLWHASDDAKSMAADAVKQVARIKVSGGVYTMYVYTQPMTMGSITASLIDMKVENSSGSYDMATVQTKDSDGNPTSFYFTMPHKNEYINVMVNPYVEIMGNSDISARLKVDYSTLTQVSSSTSLTAASTNTLSSSSSSGTSSTAKTGDDFNVTLWVSLMVISGAVIVFGFRKIRYCK